jgi:hypothetical protein
VTVSLISTTSLFPHSEVQASGYLQLLFATGGKYLTVIKKLPCLALANSVPKCFTWSQGPGAKFSVVLTGERTLWPGRRSQSRCATWEEKGKDD